MKKLALLFWLSSCPALAQQPKPVDNYTTQRLLVFNDKGELLLQNNDYGWSTPGMRATKRQSIKEALDSLGRKFGLEITAPQLAGLFTYKYTYAQEVAFRTHYRARQTGGRLVVPPDMKKAQWFPLEQAIKLISDPATGVTEASFAQMTTRMLRQPKTVWGGSWLLYKDAEGKVRSKELEPMYPLAGGGE